MNSQLRLIAAAAALFTSVALQAAPVTSLVGSTLYAFPNDNSFSAGPKVVALGITWTAENNNSVFGYNAGYGFQTNGNWGTGLSMIGTNSQNTSMTLSFDTAVSGVGAFLNWSRFSDGTPDGDLPIISIYDAAHTLLESYTLTFATGGGNNSGEFHGFLRGTADIASITFDGGFIGAANLEVVTAPAIPEPSTYALMIAGLGVVGFIARRRKA